MCRTITEGTICNGTCSCPTDAYFNSNNICQQCKQNWSFINDTCFYIFTAIDCWNSAQQTCMSAGGKLIQFSNNAVLNAISAYMTGSVYWVGA